MGAPGTIEPGSGTGSPPRRELPPLDAFGALLLRLSGEFINVPAARVDEAIDRALADSARFVGADRAYLFRYDLAQLISCNTHEWCAEGIEPQIDALQAVPMDTIPEWLDAHLRGEAVHVPDVLALPEGPLREILQPQDIRTTVALPLMGATGCRGFVGFDHVGEPQPLDEPVLGLLRLLAQMLVNVGERVETEARLSQLNATLEARVAERTEQLERARQRAEAADLAKTRLLTRVSHELRTPLNAVIGFADLLSTDPALRGAEHAAAQVRQIRQAGEHLLGMVDEMLDLSSAEAGQLRLEPRAVDVAALAAEVLALSAPQAQPLGLALEGPPDGPRDGPPGHWVWADPRRLRQVLMNLVSNAIKYNRPGGRVSLRVQAAGAAVELQVADTGAGLSAAQQACLFEPFNRLGAEHGGVPGTGLGLSIARQFVQQMGGELSAHSEPALGSCFTVRLPAAAAPVTAAGAAKAAAQGVTAAASPASGPPLKVLYVEDNPVNLLLMEAMVERSECGPVELVTAQDGAEGLARLRAQRPDLVLMDMDLPMMTGTELLAQVRSDPALRDVPCVAVSANAMPADIEEALASGFADYVTKPFTLERLAALLARYR